MNKKKIFNDPVYGFITIPGELIYDIIEHPYFQRLRRIKQLGLTDLVYPGALHTRFHHALGAMHLMTETLNNLRSKGHYISDKEFEATQIAILLHDVGHGPFSHTLEFGLFSDLTHEQISARILRRLNLQFGRALDLVIEIFEDRYPRKFLHQLVSSQLDIDRLDYLKRDSFFTGVYEGTIGADRIIKMLTLHNDELVVEEKGIYSIENFLSARRLMYWQVYLHKTAVAAEAMLISVMKRAKFLTQSGGTVEATPALRLFLERDISEKEFNEDPDLLDVFTMMDDTDIWASLKFWRSNKDFTLSTLSNMLLRRNLFRIQLSESKPAREMVEDYRKRWSQQNQISDQESRYFILKGEISNAAYLASGKTINILTKTGKVVDVAQATDLPNIKAMSKIVKKHYLSFPKSLTLSGQ